jgi:single-strand DNA-binding protein
MASFNFNQVILGGRISSDVEVKQTPNGVSVCSFSIAVNRKPSKDGQTHADFFNCTAWRNTAEFIGKYFNKGSSICVVGSIQNRSWTDNNGQKRYATDIIVDEASFVDSKNNAEGNSAPTYSNGSQGKFEPSPYIPQAYIESDLPF